MGQIYPVLTYRGDITASEEAQSGRILGWDETFRPYEVLDAEFYPGPHAPVCDRQDPHSHVLLQYATPETIKAEGDAYRLHMQLRGLLP